MTSVLVAMDGDPGDRVVHVVESLGSPFRVTRIAPTRALPVLFRTSLVVVDSTMATERRETLARVYAAPVLVIGQDIDRSFHVAGLQRLISECVSPQEHKSDSELVAIDPPLRTALRVIAQVARSVSSVVITGPTGVGKELLARRLHERSGRSGPFVPINCAAIATGLAEAMLFGHVRGAFTGAISNAKGAFVEAAGGTLFLDEIGELAPLVQAKLLRAIDQRAIRAVGAHRDTAVDVRVVAATNRNLEEEVASGRFRADLYYRLDTFRIAVPALRQRPRDLVTLVDRFHRGHVRSSVVSLSKGARQLLELYPWPGNVRELRNVLERVMSLASPGAVSPAALIALAPELGSRASAPPDVTGKGDAKQSLAQVHAETEEHTIRSYLASGSGSRQQLAEELGIHRSTLWRKMKRITGLLRPIR
ncbi:sigma 54-interacting transcriptional regulator [Pendulispora brunnea]|uniref:Sigma 54-interacting transcriptional regulator n=1 Tax=Pendulispora brunnea TaxID=2905690 RepID=A0ABZ2KP78_9BACT